MTTIAKLHDLPSKAETPVFSITGCLLAWLLPAGALDMLWQSNPLQSSGRTVPEQCQNSGVFTGYQFTLRSFPLVLHGLCHLFSVDPLAWKGRRSAVHLIGNIGRAKVLKDWVVMKCIFYHGTADIGLSQGGDIFVCK